MEEDLNKKSALNWLSLSGVIAIAFYALHIVFGTQSYPGYKWIEQAVSDLTAIDAPSYMIASRFTALYGALSCLCCVIICLILNKNESKVFRLGTTFYAIMNWISFIGYTLFPLSSSGYKGTFQDIMHFYVVTFSVVILSIVSLVLISIGGLKKTNHTVLGIIAIIALASMFFGSIGMGVFPKELFGLLERFSVFSVVIFTGVLGIWGFVQPNE
jgi:hypothetical protein